MSATDYIKTLYDKHWSLLEAHTPWAAIFAAGNRIKLNDDSRDPFKKTLNDSDFPQFGVGIGDIGDSGFNLTRGYNYRASSTGANTIWKEELTINLLMSIVMPDLRLSPATMAQLETLTALRKGGPKFGLSYVDLWGPVTSRQQITSSQLDEFGNPAGTKRLVITLNNPVKIRLDGSALIT